MLRKCSTSIICCQSLWILVNSLLRAKVLRSRWRNMNCLNKIMEVLSVAVAAVAYKKRVYWYRPAISIVSNLCTYKKQQWALIEQFSRGVACSAVASVKCINKLDFDKHAWSDVCFIARMLSFGWTAAVLSAACSRGPSGTFRAKTTRGKRPPARGIQLGLNSSSSWVQIN